VKKLSLAQMKEKQRGRVAEVSAGQILQNKLMSMGIYKGREISMVSRFRLKGPVVVKVGRSVLALGHGMASKVIVEME